MHFSDQKQQATTDVAAKASTWLDHLMSFAFLAKCRVHEDLISHLSQTAIVLQAEDACSVLDATHAFERLKAEQQLLLDNPGEVESDLWTLVKNGEPVTENELIHVRASTRSTN